MKKYVILIILTISILLLTSCETGASPDMSFFEFDFDFSSIQEWLDNNGIATIIEVIIGILLIPIIIVVCLLFFVIWVILDIFALIYYIVVGIILMIANVIIAISG